MEVGAGVEVEVEVKVDVDGCVSLVCRERFTLGLTCSAGQQWGSAEVPT